MDFCDAVNLSAYLYKESFRPQLSVFSSVLLSQSDTSSLRELEAFYLTADAICGSS